MNLDHNTECDIPGENRSEGRLEVAMNRKNIKINERIMITPITS